MKNDTVLILRIPTKLKDRLQAEADKDNRTLSDYVRLLLCTH